MVTSRIVVPLAVVLVGALGLAHAAKDLPAKQDEASYEKKSEGKDVFPADDKAAYKKDAQAFDGKKSVKVEAGHGKQLQGKTDGAMKDVPPDTEVYYEKSPMAASPKEGHVAGDFDKGTKEAHVAAPVKGSVYTGSPYKGRIHESIAPKGGAYKLPGHTGIKKY